MIIKKCIIQNFGNLSKEEFNFNCDLTAIKQENGWGKSTLAAFIKAMFYGLAKRTRSKSFSEREHYTPWNGGNFGGAIVFEYKNKDYRIERTFNQKKDILKVYDDRTNLEDKTFPKDKEIGEELFGVNLETFERSIFITLDPAKKPKSTDSLTAKLNNLVEDNTDINNYETAKKNLDDYKAKLKKNRGGGEINELDLKIAFDKQELRTISEQEKELAALKESFAQNENTEADLKTELENLQTRIAENSKFVIKKQYEQHKADQKSSEQKIEELTDFFGGKPVTEEILNDVENENKEYSKNSVVCEQNKLADDEQEKQKSLFEFFKNEIPNENEIDKCQENLNNLGKVNQKISELKLSSQQANEFAELKQKFGGKDISNQKIEQWISDLENVNTYKQYKADQKSSEQKIEELTDFFGGKPATEELLNDVENENKEYSKNSVVCEQNKLTDDEQEKQKSLFEFFKNEIPNENEIDKCQENLNNLGKVNQKISELKLSSQQASKFAELKQKFGGKDISNQKIEQWISDLENCAKIKNETDSAKQEQKNIQNEIDSLSAKQPRSSVILFVFSAIFAFSGVLSFVLSKTFSGAIFCVLFVATFLFAVLITSKTKNAKKLLSQKISEKENESQNLLAQIKNKEDEFASKKANLAECKKLFLSENDSDDLSISFLAELKSNFERFNELSEKEKEFDEYLSSLSEKPSDIEKAILDFTSKFNHTEIASVGDFIPDLRKKFSEFQRIQDKEKIFDSADKEKKDCANKLKNLLSDFKTQKEKDFAFQLQQCKDKKKELENEKENLNNILKKINEIENENDIKEFDSLKAPAESIDVMSKNQERIQNELSKIREEITNQKRKISELEENVDRRADFESEVLNLEKEKKEKEKKLELIEKTLEYLEIAKSELESRYMNKMKKSFGKYMKIFDNEHDFSITSEIQVNSDDNGSTHGSDFFSEGYKDLANICSRLALFDAMFENEKPCLILDDPFVHLDETKIEKAVNLVKELSKETQVIYLLCHESRNIGA